MLALLGLGPSFLGWTELLSSGVVGPSGVSASGQVEVRVEVQGGGAEAGGPEMETWRAGVGAEVVEVEVGGTGKEAKGARVEVSSVVGSIPRGTQGLACGAQRTPWVPGAQICGEGPERGGLSV